MIVEEVLHGLSKEVREVTVDTAARTSCYMRLKKDERYVIYGSRVSGKADRVSRNTCSFSFQVAGNETLLSALRQVEARGAARLIGKVQMKYEEYNVQGEGAVGVRVIASSDGIRRETSTNATGEFEFLNVVPGRYQLTIASEDLFEDKWRWPSEDPSVPEAGCGYQNLFVWPNGRIEGTVRATDGTPLSGVPVQAFIKDTRGELQSKPVREQKTDGNGQYVLTGLPPGEVVVGVNGEKYDDRLPWRPTFYPGTADRHNAARLPLAKGQRQTGIDLRLAPPRTSATLHIEALLEGGGPAIDVGANIENLQGIQRAFALARDEHTNLLDVPVYVGETYNVKAFRLVVEAPETVRDGQSIKMHTRSWRGEVGPILVTETNVHVRVILHEEPIVSPHHPQ